MKTAHRINKEGKIKINLKAHTHTRTYTYTQDKLRSTHTHKQTKNRPIKNFKKIKINSHKTKTSKGEKVKNKYINK